MRAGQQKTPWRSLLALALLLTTSALFASVAPALAAPAWLAPTNLSDQAQSAFAPQVALDPAGDAGAVWAQETTSGFVIESDSRPAGGEWSSPPSVLSKGAQNASAPHIALDPKGNAVAIWEHKNANGIFVIESASLLAGNWSGAKELSDDERSADSPQIAVDLQGNAVAIWEHKNANGIFVIESASHPAGGEWPQTPNVLSDGARNAFAPQIAVDPHGGAVAVWDHLIPNGKFVIESASLADGSWSASKELSNEEQSAFAPQIAVDPQGSAVAIWERVSSATGKTVIESASHPAGGEWSSPPSVLSDDEQNAFAPQVAVDPQGNAVAIWRHVSNGNLVIESASHPAGGEWPQTPSVLSGGARNAFAPQIAVDPQGNTVAIWAQEATSGVVIESASRPAGGEWSQMHSVLSDPAQIASRPQIALDPAGDAVAIWERSNGAKEVIQAAAFDATAPKLSHLQVPSKGLVGVPLSVSFSAQDAFSPLGQSSWDFGDATTSPAAANATTTHTYKKPGTYRVTLHLADALANSTQATQAIVITPEPPAPITPEPLVSTRPNPLALALRLVKVKAGVALLSLRCPMSSAAPCQGLAKLAAAKGKPRKLGQKSFRLAAGKQATIKVKLSAPARRLLAAAGAKGLAVKLSGSGVKTTVLHLRAVRTKRRGRGSRG